MTYKDIYDHVTPDNFRRHYQCSIGAPYETDDVSEGILYASQHGDAAQRKQFITECGEAARRFYSGDWGTFLAWDEENTPGAEFGEYPSIYGEIWVHREGYRTVLFFPFER